MNGQIQTRMLLNTLLLCAMAVGMLYPDAVAGFQGKAKAPEAPKAIGLPINEKIPLIEREPYDEFKLDDYNSNVIIRIPPMRDPPTEPFSASGTLIFESPDLSDDVLQVPFENVVYFKTFLQLLREDAGRLMKEEQFGLAFRNLVYIYDRGGSKDEKIITALNTCLFQDARNSYKNGNYELSLSIFEDLYRKDKDFVIDGLEKPIDLIMKSLDENINKLFQESRYDSVAKTLVKIESEYEKDGTELIQKWEAELVKKSDEMIAQARQHMNNGEGRKAHLAARRSIDVLSDRPESLELFSELVKKFPLVFVGVSSRGAGANPLSIDDWGARRVGRLTMRSVVEFDGFGDEGGKYKFLNGKISPVDEAGFIYRLTLEPNKNEFGVPALGTLELADRLLARGSAESDEYFIPFAKVVESVAIEDENNIVLHLRRQFVRPEALLQFLYQVNKGGDEAVQNGIYQLNERNDEVSVFGLNGKYENKNDAQHPDVIEWKFPTNSAAVDALIAGTIDAIDRVPLSDVSRLQESAGIEVRPYAVPTVHMLIPNQRNEFTENINYRSGLKRGLNRDLIVREMICGGREIDGCEVVSGPFPIGTADNDQISYAYDMKLRPSPSNDKLGMVLTEIVYRTKVDKLRTEGVEDPEKKVKKPDLVLAHTDDEISLIASRAVQNSWRQMGIKCELRQLEPGQVVPPDDEWDFLYYQIAIQEPLTDCERLFGAQGVVQDLSAPVQQNMRKLGYASSWQSAGVTMRRLHRQIKNDMTIIPLFQLQEFYAYRSNVKNVGRSVVDFYENVYDWEIAPRRASK